jgi:hypothetical protein
MKTKCRLVFIGYQTAADGELVKVKKPPEDVDETQIPRLELTGYENGMHTGKEIKGDISLCKDEMHDLLNGEALSGRAIFALRLVD